MMHFNDQQKKTILLAEIAALIHDIGKFTIEFLNKLSKKSHTIDFHENSEQSLKKILFETELPNDCLNFNGPGKNIKRLGELLKWHHPTIKNYSVNEYFKVKSDKELPLLLFLIMYADTIDSASSKGGAVFEKKGKREKRFSEKNLIQNKEFYMHTPFGEKENCISIEPQEQEKLKKQIKDFQEELANALYNFEKWNLKQLREQRSVIQSVLKKHLSSQLAETRLPNNDVSLWQHSYSTAVLFKAMLIRHFLMDDFDPTINGRFAQYKEKLAVMAIQWDEDKFISRAYRSKEILGLRELLIKAKDELRNAMETDLCLGNEMYRDRNGIYFMVPSDEGISETASEIFQKIIEKAETIFNDPKGIGGGIEWRVVYKNIGLQILGMADLINQNKNDPNIITLASGPHRPAWVDYWEKGQNQKEICPRCGLRPKNMTAIVSGSEGDRIEKDEQEELKICFFCAEQKKNGKNIRKKMETDSELSKKLLGVDQSAIFCKYDIDELLQQNRDEGDEDKRDNRLALIQGVLDLRWIIDGYGFSSILGAKPVDFDRPGDDNSLEIGTWEKMLKSAEHVWEDLKTYDREQKSQTAQTLQQIFRDTYLFTQGDGRAPGDSSAEKARNFIKDVVLNSPYDPKLETEAAKLVNYALRQHPAPSRLARVWEQAECFMSKTVLYCEQNRIPYSPLGQDATTFLLLVPACDAWSLIRHMQEEYRKVFGRVRHLLPFHLSSSIFYHKSPLYIGVDAARRFKKLALSRQYEWWRLKEKSVDEQKYRLKWIDGQGRQVDWTVPRKIPAGDRDDLFFSWFWVEETKNHPVHISELEPEMKIRVHPSTFDYEILDASTRRYDIRLQEERGFSRPHYMMLEVMGSRSRGPRPYPLSVIEHWVKHDDLASVPNHQRKQLVGHLAWLHQSWDSTRYRKDMEGIAKDALCLSLGKERWKKYEGDLTRMAMDGSFFDLIEWQDFIRKMDIAG